MSQAVHEHEFEAAPGLPEALPKDERILWQGAPDWRLLARRAFHIRGLALYFVAMLALRGAVVAADGGGAAEVAIAVAWLLPLVAFALALLAGGAWLAARGTLYTLTDRRVVMRIGIVLTLTLNLPLRRLAAADLHLESDGHGDVALRLAGSDRIAWLHLWPHARPWRVRDPQPMLRAIPDAARVAERLGEAWCAVTGGQPAAVTNRGPAPAVRADRLVAH